MPVPPVVVFDFDGVLTTRDTMATVVRMRLLGRPRLLLAALPSLLRRITAGDRPVRQRADRALVEVALTGLDQDAWDALAQRVGEQFVTARWMRTDLVAELRRAAASGSAVVATASETGLVRACLEAVSVRGVRVLGSELEQTSRGLRLAVHNVGDRKRATLQAAGIPLAEARFFTDSLADLPVAEVCAGTIVVGPDPRTAERLPRASWWAQG